MTTKDQERKAVEKIRKIVEELGENSYVGFAMEGVLELAEDNIRFIIFFRSVLPTRYRSMEKSRLWERQKSR